MSGEKCFRSMTSERSQTTSVSSILVTLWRAKLRILRVRSCGANAGSAFHVLMRRKVGIKRTRKSLTRISSMEMHTPITPQ